MAATEAVSERSLERQKTMKLARYGTSYLLVILKQAKLSSYCLIKLVEEKTFGIHGYLQTRMEK